MQISITDLRQKVVGTLMQTFTEEQSSRIADYLLWAEMCGIRTQGIIKLTGTTPLQKIVPKNEVTIERDTKLSQLIDAGAYPAPLVSQQAVDTPDPPALHAPSNRIAASASACKAYRICSSQ